MSNFTPIGQDNKTPIHNHEPEQMSAPNASIKKSPVDKLPVDKIISKISLSENKPIKFSAEVLMNNELSTTAEKVEGTGPIILGLENKTSTDTAETHIAISQDTDLEEALNEFESGEEEALNEFESGEEEGIPSEAKEPSKLLLKRAEEEITLVAFPSKGVNDELAELKTLISSKYIPNLRREIIITPMLYELALKGLSEDIKANTDLMKECRGNLSNGEIVKYPYHIGNKIYIKASEQEALLKHISENPKKYDSTEPLQIYLIDDLDWDKFTAGVLTLIDQKIFEEVLEVKKEKKEPENYKLTSDLKSSSKKESLNRKIGLNKEAIAQSERKAKETKLDEKAYQLERDKRKASLEKDQKAAEEKNKILNKEEKKFRIRKDDENRMR